MQYDGTMRQQKEWHNQRHKDAWQKTKDELEKSMTTENRIWKAARGEVEA